MNVFDYTFEIIIAVFLIKWLLTIWYNYFRINVNADNEKLVEQYVKLKKYNKEQRK